MARLTIAPQHVLSIARVALGGVLWAELRANEESAWALPVAVCAVALDIADGRVARARGASSAAGRLIDNASDAVFIGLAFLAFTREIGAAPLVFFILAFGSYAVRAIVSVAGGRELAPSPRGHWAGMANYGLAVLAALAAHPLVELPTLLMATASAAIVSLNALAFYDNSRLLWQAQRRGAPLP